MNQWINVWMNELLDKWMFFFIWGGFFNKAFCLINHKYWVMMNTHFISPLTRSKFLYFLLFAILFFCFFRSFFFFLLFFFSSMIVTKIWKCVKCRSFFTSLFVFNKLLIHRYLFQYLCKCCLYPFLFSQFCSFCMIAFIFQIQGGYMLSFSLTFWRKK